MFEKGFLDYVANLCLEVSDGRHVVSEVGCRFCEIYWRDWQRCFCSASAEKESPPLVLFLARFLRWLEYFVSEPNTLCHE